MMLCDYCHGSGRRQGSTRDGYRVSIFCVVCGGSGRLHCCDGERAQPDAKATSPAGPRLSRFPGGDG